MGAEEWPVGLSAVQKNMKFPQHFFNVARLPRKECLRERHSGLRPPSHRSTSYIAKVNS